MSLRPVLASAALLVSACGPVPPRAQEVRPAPHDPASWDRALLAQDSARVDRLREIDVPVRVGAFPVAPYDSPGNGYGHVALTVAGRPAAGHFATVNRNAETEPHFAGLGPDASGVVVAAVVVVGGEPGPASATSRNHPTYLAQGRIGTPRADAPDARVDWLSLALPDQPDLAVVAGRVFDLRAGRTVLVAPLADGTLRFLQVATSPFEVSGFEAMTAFDGVLGPALDTPEVRAFMADVAGALPDPR